MYINAQTQCNQRDTVSQGTNSNQALSSKLLIIQEPLGPKSVTRVVLLFPFTWHLSLFQVLSHLSFRNTVRRKIRPCHLVRDQAALFTEKSYNI